MGWNEVVPGRAARRCGRASPTASRFYFVHSYLLRARRSRASPPASTRYPDAFTSAIARDNIFATQFHPEKSSVAGLTLLGNFATWNP